MTSEGFLTPEIGSRLRDIRFKAGLTQEQVAERMGLKGPHRKMRIYRLERGLIGNPSLRTVVLFLRSCGARWTEFSDLLERVTGPEPDPAMLESAELSPEAEKRLLRKSRHEGWRFTRGLTYPAGGTPVGSDEMERGARAFLNYRVLANLVESTVRQLLVEEQVTTSDHGKYQAFARHELGKLWRAGQTPDGRNLGQSTLGNRTRHDRRGDDGFQEAAGLAPQVVARIQALVAELHEKVRKPKAQGADDPTGQ